MRGEHQPEYPTGMSRSTMTPSALPGILEARDDDHVVKARLEAEGVIVELCDYPLLRSEDRVTCESEMILSLGLSPLLPESSGRYAAGPYSRFARLGALVLRPIGIPLEFRHAGGEFTSVRCRFASSLRLKQPGEDWSDAELEACLHITDPRVEYAMIRLAEECERPDARSRDVAASLGRIILADLARYFHSVRTQAGSRKGGLPASYLRRIADHVANSPAPSSVAELAHLCGLSASHLMRAFRQSTGKSVAKYVEDIRISKAKTLLAETRLPIRDIAARLGFSTAGAFSHSFRRATGRTPRDYRNSIG